MKFKINWLEVKSTEWTIVTLLDDNGVEYKDVSINKKSKKGEEFPNFENLQAGQDVEGELWTSSAGKHYLFPPKVVKTASGAYKQKMIEDTMIKKEASIAKFQATKEESIRLMSAERDAILLVTTFYKDRWGQDPLLENELDSLIKKKCIEFRDWFMLSHEWNDLPPFDDKT